MFSLLVGLALGGLMGCQGQIGAQDRDPASGGASGRGAEDDAEPPGDLGATPEEIAERERVGCDVIDAEAGPLHRLNRSEYENSLRDLLRLDGVSIAQLPKDVADANGFAGGEAVTATLTETLARESESLSYRALAQNAAWATCAPAGTDETECARAFVDRFVTRAYRRPLTEAERGRHLALYESVRKRESYKDAIAAIMSAAIQSPNFLYRIETGEPLEGAGPLLRLTPWQTASRMSYSLWQTSPDDALWAAAESGALHEPEERRRHAERMLADPRARAAVKTFHDQWLSLGSLATAPSKVPAVIASFDEPLRNSMRASTLAFTDHVFWKPDGSVADLMLSSHKFVDAKLAPIYGVNVPSGANMAGMDLDPTARPGLLSEPSLLSILSYVDQTNPIKRGEFVRVNLLCQTMPQPPAEVDLTVPSPMPGVSTRQRFDQHRTDPACASCHRMLDPVGFGFEKFDPVGRPRTHEAGGIQIDDSGVLESVLEVEGPFVGLAGLAEKLARSPEVESCVVQHWFRYTTGRHEGKRDRCTLQAGIAALEENNGHMAAVIPALMASPGFVRKRQE
jgi:hypothetical protein